MLKYVQVDSDGYAYLDMERHSQLRKRDYAVGRVNDVWVLYQAMQDKHGNWRVSFETTDHVLFDNYLKLLLED